LRQIFYISRSQIEPADIQALYERSRRDNERAGITGMLMFTGGCFGQLIEGPEAAIGALMARIEADPRHGQVRRLLDRPVAERRFESWHMALFEAPGADDLVSELLEATEVPPQRAQRLLELMLAELAAHA
jgi:hypothetical protein